MSQSSQGGSRLTSRTARERDAILRRAEQIRQQNTGVGPAPRSDDGSDTVGANPIPPPPPWYERGWILGLIRFLRIIRWT